MEKVRSGCAINLTLEVIGDRWSLLVLRDMIFGGKRHFRELLESEEGISSNILADRLRMLTEAGILTREDDPAHRQKIVYSLTDKGIELLPVLAAMSAWGVAHMPVTEELGIRARVMAERGPKFIERFTEELREEHLGLPRKRRRGPTVREELQAAYEAVLARKAQRRT